MLLQGMEGGWVVIEASHTVRSGLNVTCHMLINIITVLTGKLPDFIVCELKMALDASHGLSSH